MGIVFQQAVTADQTYSFKNEALNIYYDIHNDSPYNGAIRFGPDNGFMSADYYMSPHSVLVGVPIPNANKAFTVKTNQLYSGMVYVYTQTPLGGTTTFSSSPAQSITIIAYGQGSAPATTTALNRMNNVGNTVGTNAVSTQNTLQNDGATANTQVVEATQVSSTGSNHYADNSGNFYLAEYASGVYNKIFQVLAGAATVIKLGLAARLVEVLGNLQVDGTSTFTGNITASGGVTGNVTGNVTGSAGSVAAANVGAGSLASGVLLTSSIPGTQVSSAVTTANNATNATNASNVAAAGVAAGSLGSSVVLTTTTAVQNANNAYYLTSGINNAGELGKVAARDMIDASSSTGTYYKGAGTNANALLQAQGTGKAYLQSGGLNSLYCDGNNGITLLAGAPLTAPTTIATFGKVVFTNGGIKDIVTVTGTGSGTYNHGMSGSPSSVQLTCSLSGSTTTVSAAAYTATQFTATMNNAFSFNALCYR